MADAPKLAFAAIAPPTSGVLVVFADGDLRLGPKTRSVLGSTAELVARVAKAEKFTGKSGAALDIVAPAGLAVSRLIVIGTGKAADRKTDDFVKLGGSAMGRIPAAATAATVVLELADGALEADAAADVALGASLRAYSFDRYKTKRKEGEEPPAKTRVTLGVADIAAARKAWGARQAVADGVILARDLVNEPPNILYPVEFARRATALRKLGVGVEVLDMRALRKLGMGALLGVGQGSAHESRVVVMRWNGGKKGAAPLAFIGKGVCFDTGGISIKPAAGMEDMKGDMAGAACVVGLMHALAGRKAKVNAIGAIGLVENMPDGNAFRPGDILTSFTGKTIEITNTDAEGRLVLCDVIGYVIDRFDPIYVVNLATLTGGIITALGHHYAGLFSNNQILSDLLVEAGKETGEKAWPFPMDDDYLKALDSRFADIKSAAGRAAQPITSAKFIEQFVGTKPWAHIDMAGPAFGSTNSEVNTSWASGWGVRLLDAFLRLFAEKDEVPKRMQGS